MHGDGNGDGEAGPVKQPLTWDDDVIIPMCDVAALALLNMFSKKMWLLLSVKVVYLLRNQILPTNWRGVTVFFFFVVYLR